MPSILGPLKSLFPSILRFKSKAIPLTVSKSFLSSLPRYQPLKVPLQHLRIQDFHKFLHLLGLCSSVKSFDNILSLFIVTGCIGDHFIAKEIIHKCTSLGDPKLALCVYHSVHGPTLFLQNWTIRCLSDHGFHSDILFFYAELQHDHCLHSDNFTFPIVIKACAAVSSLRAGKEVHSVVLRSGYGSNVGIQTALLDMYAKTSRLDCSRRVFDEMPERDLVAWNALICGYSFNGFSKEAFEAFVRMLASGLKPNTSTFVNVIPLCCHTEALDLGESLHCSAIKCGIIEDEALIPTLISMYSSFEDLFSARMLFEIVQTNLVAWNAMISAYMQNGRSSEAFEIFQLMLSSDTRPNFVTLVAILPSCINLDSICHGESVHSIAMKIGLVDQVSVVTAIVSMYSKLGELHAAEYLFQSTQDKTLVLYNSMISGYLLNGFCYLGLNTFRDLQLDGILPDAISLVSAISGCTMPQDLHSCKSIHAYSLKHGFDFNTNVMNALLALYSDCEQSSACLKLFNRMPVRNVVSWNILISRWAKMGNLEASVASFQRMCQEGWKFDVVTIINILPTFHHVKDLAYGTIFHALVIKSGHDSDIPLTNALISMYGNCGGVKAGRLLFDNLPVRSVISWNTLMTGYRNHNLYGEVMVIFYQMKMDGHKPNSITLLNLLPTCEIQLQGKSIHAYAIRNFSVLESPFLTSIVCMYSRFENLSYCRLLFDMVDKANLIAWNAMMSVYAQSKHAEEAVASFKEMLRVGPDSDPVTILTLASAYSQLGCLDLAQCVMGFVIRKGFEENTSLCNSLIDMFARCGSISIAKELFDGLKEKDSITWTVMINGYGMHGNAEAALELFLGMQEANVEPDDVTFVSILSACSHAGLVEQGQRLFTSMLEKHKFVPRMEHYACMIDLLGRMGHLDEAYDLLRKMPFMPSTSLLESLLGACHCYGDTEVGEAIGKLLLELSPHNSSSYVMLSNFHSAAGRWIDSERLRSDMDARGLKKDPGFSLIEVK